MEIIQSENHIFELVESVPTDYKIWNIGKHMVDGYLPLVKIDKEDIYKVAEEKKAIKLEGSQIILEAIGWGQDTIEEMEKYVKRYKNSKEGTLSNYKVKKFKRALPYMYNVKWD